MNISIEEMSRILEIKILFDEYYTKDQTFHVDGMVNTLRKYACGNEFKLTDEMDDLDKNKKILMNLWGKKDNKKEAKK
jgi:hypothetical protein